MKTSTIYHPIEPNRVRLGETTIYSEGICDDCSPWITFLSTSSAQAAKWRHCHLDCYEDPDGKKRIFSIAYGSANGNFSLNPSQPISTKRNYRQFQNLLIDGNEIFYPHNYEKMTEFIALSFCRKNAMDGLARESFELRLASSSKILHVRDFCLDENANFGVIGSGSLLNSSSSFASSSVAYGLIFYAQGIVLLDFQKINVFFDGTLASGISQNFSLNEKFFQFLQSNIENKKHYFQYEGLRIFDPGRYETRDINDFAFQPYGDGFLSTSFNLSNNFTVIGYDDPTNELFVTTFFSDWNGDDDGHAFLIEGSIKKEDDSSFDHNFYFSLSGSGCGFNFSPAPAYIDRSDDFEITTEWKRFFCVQIANSSPQILPDKLEFTFKIRGDRAQVDPNSTGKTFYLKDLKVWKIFSDGKLPDNRFFARRDRIERHARVFLRVSNEKCNFSLNPTFLNGDEMKNEEFYQHPIVYPTTVGLCDDDGNVLAVGKFSKPVRKSFLREIILDLNINT